MTPEQVSERLDIAMGRLENKIDRLENKMDERFNALEARFNTQRILLILAIITPIVQAVNSWIAHR
jgi:hypothetical protein